MERMMKDSGHPWIGQIPEHWEEHRFKNHAECRMGETILASDISQETGIPIYSATQEDKIFGYISDPKLLLHRNDFVIPARGNSIGNVTIVKDPIATCTQTTICAKNIHSIDTKFLYYCCIGLKQVWFYFDVTAIPQITVKQVENNIVPVPPIKEQAAIAAYLDKKCGEIDELIDVEQQMIADLEAYRQAVITAAVTRGLNPDVSSKETGIDGIGQIPEHWEKHRFKNHAECRMGETILASDISQETGIPIYSATQEDKIFGYISDPKLLLHRNDFVIPARGNSIGNVTIVKDPIATCTQTTICAKNIHSIDTKFLYYCCIGLKQVWFYFDVTAIPQITVNQVENNMVPFPPMAEQQEITGYLDKKCSEIDELITMKQEKIDTLKQYRQSLIFEAVTGKTEMPRADKT